MSARRGVRFQRAVSGFRERHFRIDSKQSRTTRVR